ncbi:MAG: hypothetical protein Ct9H90mP9_4210 [Pseudomonadota bacterium]|nr:MAG: hypothetical protein Ct9H90mP9_4210 [Pseudomonadota bacterium]
MEVAQIGPGVGLPNLGKRFPDHQTPFPSLETIETLGLAMTRTSSLRPWGRSSVERMMHPHGVLKAMPKACAFWGGLNPNPGFGLNLSRRAMLGVLKYPGPPFPF